MSDVIFKANGVTQQFGGLIAVNDVSCEVRKGEIVGIIGPNGAGKTTLFNMITGIYKPTSGTMVYNGTDITGKKPHEIAEIGLARTFQNIRLFQHMTVLENVMVGRHTKNTTNVLESIFKLKGHKETEKEAEAKALRLLELVGLADYRYEYATSLAYGLQRRLEIARAMATDPTIMLLDEPAAGMNEQETSDLTRFIREIRDMGYTIVLIEHDMRLVMNLCDRVYVLDRGALIANGVPAEIKKNKQVIEAYLGKGAV